MKNKSKCKHSKMPRIVKMKKCLKEKGKKRVSLMIGRIGIQRVKETLKEFD